MNLNQIIKTISGIVAAVIVFFMAGGLYLSSKGFVMQDDGSIVLVRSAYAEDDETAKELPVIPDNIVLPDNHSMGSQNAPITIYEYSSFGCSHCADFHLEIMPELKEAYVDKGLLRVVFVPFPIDKTSMNAALLAECVPDDKYFAYVELLFKKQREWGLARNPLKVLKQYAALSGVAVEKADACLKNDRTATELLTNRQNGLKQLGIQGTPSFVVSMDGHNELISGARSFDGFAEIIDARLAARKSEEGGESKSAKK